MVTYIKKKLSSGLKSFIIPILVALFNVLILLFPTEIIGASRDGLGLWFNNVIPSLIPFIIGTNILTGLGVINFLGVLMSPLMYPLFGVNGAGGFAFITGMTSGYPMGAKITAALRERNDISRTEAQRLCSFTNNSGPLFVLGAVGVGMFNSAKIGYFILAVHYVTALITGFLFKYYRYSRENISPPADKLFKRAYTSMLEGRKKDGRPFGRLLGDSVRNTMETILQIGGFIILFCVIVKIFEVTEIFSLMQTLFSSILRRLDIGGGIFNGAFVGILEMTNGARLLAQESALSSQSQAIIAACGIISFGGFSIHAQSISFLSKTDINIPIYMLSKVMNGVIAMILSSLAVPFFEFAQDTKTVYASAPHAGSVIDKLAYSSAWFFLSPLLILACMLLYNTLRNRER